MTQDEKNEAMDMARLLCNEQDTGVHTCFYICSTDGCDERYNEDGVDIFHCPGHRVAA